MKRERIRRHLDAVSAARAAALLLVIFLLVFPKGGVKLAGIPITWGYLLVGLTGAIAFPACALAGRFHKMTRARIISLWSLIPFGVITLFALAANGTQAPGYTVALFVTFGLLPAVLLVAAAPYIDHGDMGLVFRAVRTGMLLIAAYGILLFVWRQVTGAFFEIPYLTVNAGDAGALDYKYIDRGGIFKLISTYNNGNIYGICVLMLLPLYTVLESRSWPRWVIRISLILTLSRTVWIGLVLWELLSRFYVRRPSMKQIVGMSAVVMAIAIGIANALALIGMDMSFLMDRRLGGRLHQFSYLGTGFFSDRSFAGFEEVAYLTVAHNFGLVGLVAYLLALLTPLGLYFAGALYVAPGAYHRTIVSGMVIYLVLAMSDGAILLIPVMAFYWFLAALLLAPTPNSANAARRTT